MTTKKEDKYKYRLLRRVNLYITFSLFILAFIYAFAKSNFTVNNPFLFISLSFSLVFSLIESVLGFKIGYLEDKLQVASELLIFTGKSAKRRQIFQIIFKIILLITLCAIYLPTF